MARGIDFKVTPEVLDQRGLDLLYQINSSEKLYGQIRDVVTRTSSYWKGEAGNHHRQMFREQDDEIKAIFDRLHNYPVNLNEISARYKKVEAKEKTANASVPNNLIV